MRSLVLPTLLLTCGCLPGRAALIPDAREVMTTPAPVVCGPMGFRRVPLQARWGEYLRVIVRSPAPLRGAARVFAGGRALPLTSWHAGVQWAPFSEAPLVLEGAVAATLELSGQAELRAPLANTYEAVVVNAEFPNEDPDARSALSASAPIDITLSELEGASCEGAVLTVEQGALVPNVSEAAWLAELERRGGPELQARREAARRAADERRSAYLAELEVRTAARRQAQAELAARRRWCEEHVGSCPELAVRAAVLPETLRLALEARAAASVSASVEVPDAAPEPAGATPPAAPWHAGLAAGLALDAPGCGWPQCASGVPPLPDGLPTGPAPLLAVSCGVSAPGVGAPALRGVAAVPTGSVGGATCVPASSSGEPCRGVAVGYAQQPGSNCGTSIPVATASDTTVTAADSVWLTEEPPASCGAAPSLAGAIASGNSGESASVVVVDGQTAAGAVSATAWAESEEWSMPAQAEWELPRFDANLQGAAASTATVTRPAAPRHATVRVETNVVPFLVDLIGFGLGVAASQHRCSSGCQPVHAAVPVTP